MKATVWIDTFQVAIMFTGNQNKSKIYLNILIIFEGLFAIVIKGTYEIPGGFKELWNRANRSGRVDFFK